MNDISGFKGMALSGSTGDDLTAKLAAFVRHREAFSANTWRQLLSVMRICWRWSQENRRSFLPMTPDDMQDYLFHLQATGRSTSTISVHAALISMLHRNAGLVPPTVATDVVRARKKINRTAVMSGERTGQAAPFCRPDLNRLDAAWSHSPPPAAAARPGVYACCLQHTSAHERAFPSADQGYLPSSRRAYHSGRWLDQNHPAVRRHC